MEIVLSLGLFGIIVGVAYWFAREEQKTIKRIPPEEMDEKHARHDARPQPVSLTFLPLRAAQKGDVSPANNSRGVLCPEPWALNLAPALSGVGAFSLCVRGNSALFAFLLLCGDGH